MLLDKYLNYLQENEKEDEKEEKEEEEGYREEEDQGEEDDEDDEEEVEEKAALLRKFSKLVKDPFGKQKLAKLSGPEKEKLMKKIKMKKRVATGAGVATVGAGGFLAAKKSDIKVRS
jgi:hypothetical protein